MGLSEISCSHKSRAVSPQLSGSERPMSARPFFFLRAPISLESSIFRNQDLKTTLRNSRMLTALVGRYVMLGACPHCRLCLLTRGQDLASSHFFLCAVGFHGSWAVLKMQRTITRSRSMNNEVCTKRRAFRLHTHSVQSPSVGIRNSLQLLAYVFLSLCRLAIVEILKKKTLCCWNGRPVLFAGACYLCTSARRHSIRSRH
jgi:hypothetical protein